MKIRFVLLLSLITILSSFVSVRADDKLTAEEIIAKHLESIGSKEKRQSINDQTIMCSVEFTYKGSATIVNGNSVFASAGKKNLVGMLLNSNDYPQDKFSFDGEKIRVAFTKPGIYSILGDLIFNNHNFLKNGVLGGALFSSWVLHDPEQRGARIKAEGTKKIGGNEAYVLDFAPKGGFDFEIKMYFDKKTFRHIQTEYSRVIAARPTSDLNASAGQSSDRVQIIETFSDFQDMKGLTLPGKYTLGYEYYNNSPTQASKSRNRELQWKFKVTGFSYNQNLDPNSFIIETN